jgi:hypothetical protein
MFLSYERSLQPGLVGPDLINPWISCAARARRQSVPMRDDRQGEIKGGEPTASALA